MKRKKTHRVYAFFLILFAILILALSMFLLFHIQSIEVEGNEYCSSETIIDSVQNDKLSSNSLYIFLKYKFGKGDKLPCMESMEIKMVKPWSVKVIVKEKQIVGYVTDSDGGNYFFDRQGFVVLKSETLMEGIPLVEGIDIDQKELYQKLKNESSKIYEEILETSQEMRKYDLSVDKIVCRADRIYVYIGNVCVNLGSHVSAQKIAQIPNIMEKLEEKKGTLHLENFSDGKGTITFDVEEDIEDTEEFPEEN